MAAVHRDKPGRSTRWPPDQPQTEARHVITPCHPRCLIMLDGAARPKGATRRCAAGPRRAPDPGSPIQKPAAAGGQARSKQATPPNRAAASGHWPGPVIRLTPAGSTDKQGSPVLRWAMVEASSISPPAARSAASKTASSPAAARRRRTSPRPPRPATCSPACSTRCVMATSAPWRPAPPRPRHEQPRARAARHRPQVWPPPPAARPRFQQDAAARDHPKQ